MALPKNYKHRIDPKLVFEDDPINMKNFVRFIENDCHALIVEKGGREIQLFNTYALEHILKNVYNTNSPDYKFCPEYEQQQLLRDYICDNPEKILEAGYCKITIYMFNRGGYKLVATRKGKISVRASRSFKRYIEKWGEQPEPEADWCSFL